VPIGGSIVCDEVAQTVANAGDFNHGYTYSGHPVAAAVALENLRIIEEEGLVERVREEIAPYLAQAWAKLGAHPLVGEARSLGLLATIALTPNKATRAQFAADTGTVGTICREHCFANGLVMRHVGDRMIIAPPLVITTGEIDLIIERATRALDATLADIKRDGLFVEA
jgi:putrescine aminotransferase